MASLNSSDGNLADISKMKVVEIKKELKNKGLNTAGTKNELIQRLQAASSQAVQDSISEDGNVDAEIDEDAIFAEIDEGEDVDDDDLTTDAVLAEEPKVKAPESPKLAVKRPAPLAADTPQGTQPKKRVLVRPPSVTTSTEKENSSQEKSADMEAKEKTDADPSGKKVVKLSSISVKERLELRAQKFGVPLTDMAKKEARAARFGISPAVSIDTSQITTSTKITILGPSDEVLKKRAQRFGVNVSSFALKAEESEKLKKRQERFGVSAATVESLDEKKKLRAERFKL
uniref:SAP domain-containing protein n=1 Tax=Graphocephala atropunctata TaxID=36148 RepID=A0A1B6MGY2_9HEMI